MEQMAPLTHIYRNKRSRVDATIIEGGAYIDHAVGRYMEKSPAALPLRNIKTTGCKEMPLREVHTRHLGNGNPTTIAHTPKRNVKSSNIV